MISAVLYSERPRGLENFALVRQLCVATFFWRRPTS